MVSLTFLPVLRFHQRAGVEWAWYTGCGSPRAGHVAGPEMESAVQAQTGLRRRHRDQPGSGGGCGGGALLCFNRWNCRPSRSGTRTVHFCGSQFAWNDLSILGIWTLTFRWILIHIKKYWSFIFFWIWFLWITRVTFGTLLYAVVAVLYLFY